MSKLDVAFVAELESRFQRESVRVPWRNLLGKRGRTTQRLDFFDFLAAFIGARLFA